MSLNNSVVLNVNGHYIDIKANFLMLHYAILYILSHKLTCGFSGLFTSTSFGHGLLATTDGYMYRWELPNAEETAEMARRIAEEIETVEIEPSIIYSLYKMFYSNERELIVNFETVILTQCAKS